MTDLNSLLETGPDTPRAAPRGRRWAILAILAPFAGVLAAFAVVVVVRAKSRDPLGITETFMGFLTLALFILLGVVCTIRAFLRKEAPGFVLAAIMVNLLPALLVIGTCSPP